MIPAGVVTALLSPWIGRLTGRVNTRVVVLTGLGLIGLFSLFLSSFTGGSSVVFTGAGILGLSVGFMVVMTTIIGAAASELPPQSPYSRPAFRRARARRSSVTPHSPRSGPA
jgi:MFS family permease